MSASPDTCEPDMIRALQESAARAQPAEHVEDLDGWWLRHSPTRAWWISAVLPHGDATRPDLQRRILDAERFHAAHATPARFQITPHACPETLDPLLAERGYHRRSPVSLQIAPTTQVRTPDPADSLRVHLDDEPTRAWFDVWHTVHGHGDDARAERDMLARVHHPSTYASALLDDEVVAVGRAVTDHGRAGIFSMATLPPARGRRAGHGVLAALARWAADRDADQLYLQVESDNTAARRLYERAGFTEVCTYHYRTAS